MFKVLLILFTAMYFVNPAAAANTIYTVESYTLSGTRTILSGNGIDISNTVIIAGFENEQDCTAALANEKSLTFSPTLNAKGQVTRVAPITSFNGGCHAVNTTKIYAPIR